MVFPKILRNALMLLVVSIMGIGIANAQTGTLKGTVVDQNSDPLAGATLTVKGTSKGTACDVDGNFTLTGLKRDAKILVSYVGYEPTTVTYTG